MIRNPYGFCSNVDDGDLLRDVDISQSAVSSYDDLDVVGGKFYYYTVFLGGARPAWNAGLTYQLGDIVNQSGTLYIALRTTTNETPGVVTTAWQTSASSSPTTWIRAGDIAVLTVKDFGYRDRIFDLTPRTYKELNTRELSEAARNSMLYKFLGIFGFHLDMLRTEYETILNANDPKTVQYKYLVELSRQVGLTFEPAISPRLSRLRAQYATTIYREKGKPLGLENLVNVMTGWDATVAIGNNLMLNGDQSSFMNPLYEQWNQTVNYPTGTRVYYNGYVYQTNAGGAYGLAQAPTGGNSNNTWWNVISYSALVGVSNPLYNSTTGNISTWEASRSDTGALVSANTTILGGLHPVVQTDFSANQLKIANSSGTTGDIYLRSISRATGETLPNKLQVVGDGIPVEHVYQWDQTKVYAIGDVVAYSGIRYECKVIHPVAAPTGSYKANTEWKVYEAKGQNSFTDTYLSSAYFNMQETAGTGVVVQGFVEWYDQWGQRMNGPTFPTSTMFGRVDTFNYPCIGTSSSFTPPYDLNNQIDPPIEPGVWGTNASALWTVSPSGSWKKLQGVAYPATPSGVRLATMTAPTADMSVYATMRTLPASSQAQGIVFRYTNTSNYWRATRTALQKINAGVVTTVITYATAIVDGERLFVNCSGTTITVAKYLPYSSTAGIQTSVLATTADSFNSTATGAGMYTE